MTNRFLRDERSWQDVSWRIVEGLQENASDGSLRDDNKHCCELLSNTLVVWLKKKTLDDEMRRKNAKFSTSKVSSEILKVYSPL